MKEDGVNNTHTSTQAYSGNWVSYERKDLWVNQQASASDWIVFLAPDAQLDRLTWESNTVL